MVMAKTAAKKLPAPTVEIFEDVEQQSEEWFQLRLGVPTASNFGIMMASGKDGDVSKTRRELMYKLAGEILTGRPAEGKIVTAAMQRGNDMEPEARQHYLNTHFAEVRRVGFIRRKLPSGRYVGCSPDALIGKKKALEIKTLAPHLMIERLVNGAGLPAEHRPQVHGTMWIADLEEVDLLLFYSGMPVAPKFTIKRDESYIKQISNAVEIFEYETRMLVEKIRKMG
jgi:hypothetical protein